jgi:hypothetical protein
LRSNEQESEADWQIYERLVGAFYAENSGIEVSVTSNARLEGQISGIPRQIDVLIDARWGDNLSRRIIVDAKYRGRKLTVNDIERFEGMMKDCRAEHGILICPNGWSQGAKRRAQDAITIHLLSLAELEARTSWASIEKCIGECVHIPRKRSRKGLVIWDGNHAINEEERIAIVFSGKCDVCHNFHVWCWDCGEKFALSHEDEHQCYCERNWVTAIEEETQDPTGETLNAVHLLLSTPHLMLPLDRLQLR